ncbi:hypothetical protein DAERI_040210 [Deinococcus aerius]|uniref:DUF2259 domain-containing protein n=1 Tax=Deinococcus aerius TaxID=200253 RepID=A0A2I9D534_9DEIO|nr:DUF2259 domain-containing protein [Deinococcus aerius]GBF05450.1 hypothetical protein DAERI_040210 [Deinococcus aerius]
MRALRTTALTLLALASAALAGNRLDVRQVTFSADGTRALVLTAGVLDGSGFSYAAAQALDTRTGRTLLRASAQSGTRPVPAVVSALLARERSRLAPLGLASGRAARPVFAQPVPTHAPVWTEGTPAGSTLVAPVRLWTRPVPVRLSVRRLPSGCRFSELLPRGEGPAGFTLTVNGQTVQSDRVLPAGRECAARYALERVYVRGNRAVFIVRAYTPGFEGPNAEVVPVAALLK